MNTAIIALDYIVDIMHPDGKIARSAQHASERNIVEKANRALEIARAKRWPVVLVKVGFSPSYIEQPKHSPMFGRANEFGALNVDGPGTQFHPELYVAPSDFILTKPRVSAFYGTNLEAVLRANAVEQVVLAGVSTTWAVQSTARDAHDRDYIVAVLEEACAAASDDEHQASMKVLSGISKIVSVGDLKLL
ncbi:isochorismatase family cysteine hydrolase [Pandoraea sputorum]|uniref:Isochorismatase n=1 Tax=Pandoraea sputorum TaxID=93222 RepID=A0A5E5ARS0_9BURK|nr:isochorismatase family cysteine hydrolase [Pandoraea sputorum]VVE75707.1 isochorismatase [Pandoraea sputorum]